MHSTHLLTKSDMKRINVEELPTVGRQLAAGETVLLSGKVYCARDAAHKKLFELKDSGKKLPLDLKNAVIYYAGPTPEFGGRAVGSCGPTTSSRMDKFTPELISMGVIATIGKGKRSAEVVEAIRIYKAMYFCAIGGAGAIASQHITKSEIIAFPELGCEALRLFEFEDFPLIVGIDCNGNIAMKA